MICLIERAKALMDQLPDGPWRWDGDKNDVRQVFRKIDNQDPWKHSGLIHYGWQQKLYVSRAPHDLSTIIDIDHPLAQLIKLIPDLVAALGKTAAELELGGSP